MGKTGERGGFVERILIVEDDVRIGDMLAEALSREGYAVARAFSGTEAAMTAEASRPDLVLLDLMLPGLSSEALLPKLAGTPVIVVSARDDVDSRVAMLLTGAVDFVPKPFELRELLARVKLRLRESRPSPALLTRGDIELDTLSRAVTVAGVPVHLTRTEYAILKQLMESPGQVVTKSRILNSIGPDTPDCTENSLKTHMSHLRSKLPAGAIESVWGIGFRLR